MDTRVTQLYNRLYNELSRYTDNKNVVASVMSQIDKSEFQPYNIVLSKHIDKENLFGDVDKVIGFLSRYKGKGLRISEKWSGYEDNYFTIDCDSRETDEDVYIRLVKQYQPILVRLDKEYQEKLRKKATLLKEIANLGV